MKMLTERRLRELLEYAYWQGAKDFAYPYLTDMDKANEQIQIKKSTCVDLLMFICDREENVQT